MKNSEEGVTSREKEIVSINSSEEVSGQIVSPILETKLQNKHFLAEVFAGNINSEYRKVQTPSRNYRSMTTSKLTAETSMEKSVNIDQKATSLLLETPECKEPLSELARNQLTISRENNKIQTHAQSSDVKKSISREANKTAEKQLPQFPVLRCVHNLLLASSKAFHSGRRGVITAFIYKPSNKATEIM